MRNAAESDASLAGDGGFLLILEPVDLAENRGFLDLQLGFVEIRFRLREIGAPLFRVSAILSGLLLDLVA
jgi:hypothetical protein